MSCREGTYRVCAAKVPNTGYMARLELPGRFGTISLEGSVPDGYVDALREWVRRYHAALHTGQSVAGVGGAVGFDLLDFLGPLGPILGRAAQGALGGMFGGGDKAPPPPQYLPPQYLPPGYQGFGQLAPLLVTDPGAVAPYVSAAGTLAQALAAAQSGAYGDYSPVVAGCCGGAWRAVDVMAGLRAGDPRARAALDRAAALARQGDEGRRHALAMAQGLLVGR